MLLANALASGDLQKEGSMQYIAMVRRERSTLVALCNGAFREGWFCGTHGIPSGSATGMVVVGIRCQSGYYIRHASEQRLPGAAVRWPVTDPACAAWHILIVCRGIHGLQEQLAKYVLTFYLRLDYRNALT